MVLGIHLHVQSEIDQRLMREIYLGGISMTEVKASLDSEPVWSKT